MPHRYRTFIADNARWDRLALRPGDIIITTPPKCGTTWLQMICALLIFQTADLPKPLDLISPWLDQLLRPIDSVIADLDAQTHRRFIKTHTPFDGLPQHPEVTYLAVGRDPRDVALSLDNHRGNFNWEEVLKLRQAAHGIDDLAEFFPEGVPQRLESERDRIWGWIDDPAPVDRGYSFAALINHLSTFFAARERPNVNLLHYADLKEDLEGQMRQLAARLQIDVPEESWPELVSAASFEQMRGRAKETGPNQTESVWLDDQRFFHRARLGEWRGLFDDDDLRRYAARVEALTSPDLSEWLHRGPIQHASLDPDTELA